MKRITMVLVLTVVVTALASAYGGGGWFNGHYFPMDEFTNTSVEAEINGGYGYGVGRDGSRYGGFGMVIHDHARPEEVIGAFGGVITGRQFRGWPFTLSANLWTGIGYLNPSFVSSSGGVGFVAEADVEAGLRILPWFQLSLYAGMQVISGFDLQSLVDSAIYTPVIGARFTWGSF